jgi:hypothetical protein
MAAAGQALIHWPQRTQTSAAIVWACVTAPEMAFTGQLRAHLVQPMHLAPSIV